MSSPQYNFIGSKFGFTRDYAVVTVSTRHLSDQALASYPGVSQSDSEELKTKNSREKSWTSSLSPLKQTPCGPG